MIDFPASPTVGQTFQVGNIVYKCVAINPAVWSATAAQSGIPEAPVDGKVYGRVSADWAALTKASVGLDQVNNTSDINKPISSATQTALNGKEPTIVAGTTAQYRRGDKTWQTLDKFAVGLNQVDNTPDASKTVSSALYMRSGANAGGSLIPFSWADDGTQPAYIWGGNNVEGRVYYRTNLKVGACATADNANAVNGISGWNYSNRSKNPVYMWCTDGSGSDQYLTQPGYLSVSYAQRVASVEGAGGGTLGSGLAVNGEVWCNGRLHANNSIQCKQGVSGGEGGNCYNWYWDGAGHLYAFVDSTNVGWPSMNCDERIKKNLLPLVLDVAAFMKIKTVEFAYNGTSIWPDDGVRHWGFSAQNLEEVMPKAVIGSTKAMQDDGVTPQPASIDTTVMLTQAVLMIQAHERTIASLKSRIERLEAQK